MCRNIKTLANFEPPATHDEIHASALQFVRKLSGTTKPSRANEAAFNQAVEEVTAAAHKLIQSLKTTAPTRNREVEMAKAAHIEITMSGESYFTMLTATVISMGGIFEMPPVIFILSRIGLVSAATFDPGVRMPCKFNGSAALSVMSSSFGEILRIERNKPMASGSANCSPLTPLTK